MEADFLVRLASSDEYNIAPELCMEIKEQPSTEGEQVLAVKKQVDWMTPIIHFLKEGQLPEDKMKAWKIQIRAAPFVVINDVLYKRGHSLPYLRCPNPEEASPNPEEANYVLREIHEGICGNHAGAMSLAGKALRAGYN